MRDAVGLQDAQTIANHVITYEAFFGSLHDEPLPSSCVVLSPPEMHCTRVGCGAALKVNVITPKKGGCKCATAGCNLSVLVEGGNGLGTEKLARLLSRPPRQTAQGSIARRLMAVVAA